MINHNKQYWFKHLLHHLIPKWQLLALSIKPLTSRITAKKKNRDSSRITHFFQNCTAPVYPNSTLLVVTIRPRCSDCLYLMKIFFIYILDGLDFHVCVCLCLVFRGMDNMDNNPTAGQFQGIVRRLMVWCGVSPSTSGNVAPQNETVWLSAVEISSLAVDMNLRSFHSLF